MGSTGEPCVGASDRHEGLEGVGSVASSESRKRNPHQIIVPTGTPHIDPSQSSSASLGQRAPTTTLYRYLIQLQWRLDVSSVDRSLGGQPGD